MRDFFENKKYRTEAIAIVLFAIASFVFLAQSSLHPWIGKNVHTDSAVYKTIAMMMQKGYMPYRDTFDHKGPLMYIINYIGNLLSSYKGVWVIEYISLTFTLYMMRKIALISKCGEIQAVISVVFAVSLLFEFFDGGNMTEEYAMPFIAVSLFIFLDYFCNEKITKLRLCICGFCLGCVLMLRPNMIAVWFVFCVAVLIKCLVEKNYAELIKFIIWFSIGLALIVVPIVVWLGVNHALPDFWFDYITFNTIYSTSEGGMTTEGEKVATFFFFLNNVVHYAALVSTAYLLIKKKEKIYAIYLVFLFVNFATVIMSGLQFGHYGMTMIPTMVFPLTGFMEDMGKVAKNTKVVSIGLSMVLLIASLALGWKTGVIDCYLAYVNRNESGVSDRVRKLSEIVKENTTPDEKISVYGNYDIVYVVSDREHATKYSYQTPIGSVYEPIREEYFSQLKKEQPKLIIVQKGRYGGEIEKFLTDNSYEVLWAEDEDSLHDCYPVFIKR